MKQYWETPPTLIHALNRYVDRLIEKGDVSGLYQEYKEEFLNINPFVVLGMHAWTEEKGLSDEEISSIAGKLMNTFRKSLEMYAWKEEETSTFVSCLFQESSKIKDHLDTIKERLKQDKDYCNQHELLLAFTECLEIDKRFLKMENILFPYLERWLPNPRPLGIMWKLHDQARSVRKWIIRAFEEKDNDSLRVLIGEYFFLIHGILEKEELLLLPVASKLATSDDWNNMLHDADEFGYAWMKGPTIPTTSKKTMLKDEPLLFQTETGGLSLEDLMLIVNTIGVDITFVNDKNEVQFFNQTKERIFPRSPSVIGRLVKHCHPPKSVAMVEDIIEAFRTNKQDKATFHITMGDKFLFIQYFAIRNQAGIYKGVLEVTQDVTEIRALDGEKRLLSWENEKK